MSRLEMKYCEGTCVLLLAVAEGMMHVAFVKRHTLE